MRCPASPWMLLQAAGRRSARRAALGFCAYECRGAPVSATSTCLASHREPMAHGQYLHNTRNLRTCGGGVQFPASPWMLLQASGRRSARRAALGFRANEFRGASVSATSIYLDSFCVGKTSNDYKHVRFHIMKLHKSTLRKCGLTTVPANH